MKILKYTVGGVVAVAVVLVVALLTFVQLRWDRTFALPEVPLAASQDPELIERGAYLAYGPAHCAYCHTTQDKWPELRAGKRVPLSGGYEIHMPPGVLRGTNLTPDPTGIAHIRDGQLARLLRHNLRHDGRAAIPVMAYENLADDDVVALLSFLRAQPAVPQVVPDSEYNLMGKAVMALAIEPTRPDGTPPTSAPPAAATVERGKYLADVVCNCKGCHSERNLMDGSYIGAPYAGGMRMERDGHPDQVLVTPNLTPDPDTGCMSNWSEDDFVERFQGGDAEDGSHMPWAAYTKMSEDDLRGMYRYLRTLAPVRRDIGDVIQPR